MEKGYDFLFWAYNVVWVGIVAYVAYLVVRLGQVRARLERLERKIAGAGAREDQKSSGS